MGSRTGSGVLGASLQGSSGDFSRSIAVVVLHLPGFQLAPVSIPFTAFYLISIAMEDDICEAWYHLFSNDVICKGYLSDHQGCAPNTSAWFNPACCPANM